MNGPVASALMASGVVVWSIGWWTWLLMLVAGLPAGLAVTAMATGGGLMVAAGYVRPVVEEACDVEVEAVAR